MFFLLEFAGSPQNQRTIKNPAKNQPQNHKKKNLKPPKMRTNIYWFFVENETKYFLYIGSHLFLSSDLDTEMFFTYWVVLFGNDFYCTLCVNLHGIEGFSWWKWLDGSGSRDDICSDTPISSSLHHKVTRKMSFNNHFSPPPSRFIKPNKKNCQLL